jgi:hypothetical protein
VSDCRCDWGYCDDEAATAAADDVNTTLDEAMHDEIKMKHY